VIVAAGLFAALLFGFGLFVLAHGIGPAAKLADHAPDTTNPETTAQGSQPIYESWCEFSSTAPLGADCTFLVRAAGGGVSQDSFQASAIQVDVPAAWLRQQPHGTMPNDPAVVAALLQTAYNPAGTGAVSGMAISVDPTYAARLKAVGITPLQLLDWIYSRVPPQDWPPWLPRSGA
jgi:hypothetical protein